MLPVSLRDYFAGQALAGIAHRSGSDVVTAEEAYVYADAMLAERDR